MTCTVHLLGRPHLDGAAEGYRFRSRKSWALLAYLLLTERPPTRGQLAELLFDAADDPLRALRWSLAELRRAFGEDAVGGDPVTLRLPPGTMVDVEQVLRGAWADAVRLPGLGATLLDGLTVRGAAAFESWLLHEQRRVAAASEAILHEAALGSLSRGALDDAVSYAVRAAAMSPLDENHQALLIRLYRLAGDDTAAEAQFAACREVLGRELGVEPGAVVLAALRERRADAAVVPDAASIEALLEAGAAAVSAGAAETGADSLRTAVRLADAADVISLRVTTRLLLAEALIHSLGGLDEEGMAALLAADDIAQAHGARGKVAEARAELGYVDFLRARYDRAEVWLTDALELGGRSPWLSAKATTYLGSVRSDRGDYPAALRLLREARTLAQAAGDVRREAFAVSMLGRVHLLRHDLSAAASELDSAIELAERDHWLAFLPWPQAMRGEVELARGELEPASEHLRQAFARACQVGDPCWEGMSARALALLAEAEGDTDRAFAVLADARVRCNRLADPYVWLDAYILDAQCALGRRHGHADTALWVETMSRLASRTDMREMTVRALLHRAAIGHDGDAEAARLLAEDIDNPGLAALLGT